MRWPHDLKAVRHDDFCKTIENNSDIRQALWGKKSQRKRAGKLSLSEKITILILFQSSGISFVDSTTISVCHNKRSNRNKVFAGIAKKSKSTMGWFFGFKLHLIVNDQGEIISFSLSKGNVDDRKPVPKMARKLFCKLFGDKGYISSKLRLDLQRQGVTLVTSVKKNMKNQMQIEHTRHRSPNNFIVHLLSGLIAYSLKPKKPSLNLFSDGELSLFG